MAAALSAMRRAIMDMASLADLVLLGMGSVLSIIDILGNCSERSPIINRPASSRIAPSECFYRHSGKTYRRHLQNRRPRRNAPENPAGVIGEPHSLRKT